MSGRLYLIYEHQVEGGADAGRLLRCQKVLGRKTIEALMTPEGAALILEQAVRELFRSVDKALQEGES